MSRTARPRPLLALLLAVPPLLGGEPELPREFAGATPLAWAVRMADSEIARRGDRLEWKEGGTARWDYAAGLFTLALLRLDERVHNPAYMEFARRTIGSFITPDGQIRDYRPGDCNLDHLNPGKTLLALHRLTREERYRKAAALLRRQLDAQPRTREGGFWHKQRYPQQMWLDGLYMATPFYAEYARQFEEPAAAFEDVVRQIRLIGAHAYAPDAGLFFHGWDEARAQDWADKATGTSPCFWSRGMGWFAMALVDDLDFLPADHPGRPEVVALLQKLCAGLVRHQDPTSGLWYQVTDQGARPGNYLEATASCMFLYTFAKGLRGGYLDGDLLPALLRGYRGLTERLVTTDDRGAVTLTACCKVAGLGYGRDGSFAYYIGEPVVENDLKGVGPFILAGLELQRLLDGKPL